MRGALCFGHPVDGLHPAHGLRKAFDCLRVWCFLEINKLVTTNTKLITNNTKQFSLFLSSNRESDFLV